MLQNSIVAVATSVCSQITVYTRIGSFLRRLIWRHKVGIALYHSVGRHVLESHLRILQKNYNLISLSLFVDALWTNDWGRIPRNALAITFDDGAKDLYRLADLLAENNVPATVYLVSDLIGTHRHFWFNEVKDPHVVEWLMRQPNSERLAYLRQQVGYTDHTEYEERQALSMDEIHQMAASGVQFGAHTGSHPILPACEDSVAQREIMEVKTELEAKTGFSIEHFCYPNGDYTARDEALVRQAGYRSARTVERGLNGRGTSPYRLKVVDVLEDRSAADLELIECRLVWYGVKEWFGRIGGLLR